MPQHKWVPSTLGHGDAMCAKCLITNREAAVIGSLNKCSVPEPNPEPNKESTSNKEDI